MNYVLLIGFVLSLAYAAVALFFYVTIMREYEGDRPLSYGLRVLPTCFAIPAVALATFVLVAVAELSDRRSPQP